MSRVERTLGDRVTSSFENGYADEGLLAEGVHGAIVAVVIGTSLLLPPVMVVCWLGRRISRCWRSS